MKVIYSLFRTFSFAALALILSVSLVSCETDSMDQQEMQTADFTVYDVLDYNSSNSTNEKRPAPKKGDDPIAAIAINAEFNELVAALVYVDEELDAGLVNLFLNGTDQYTVFAPTDEAFEELYSALKVDGIRDIPAETVLNVLLYHVTEGRRASNSVVPKRNTRTIESLLGASFEVNTSLEIMAIGSTANIVAADISASNGIIHVIDSVLLPIVVQ